MLGSRQSLLFAAVLLALPATTAAADEPAVSLKNGDRIIFLGDSITAGGAKPGGYIKMIQKALEVRHADWKLDIIGAGVSGNKVPDLQRRLDRDVLAKKPTVVVIYIGINDVWHGEKDPARGTPKDKFEAGLKDIIQKITASGARVVLCTPSVIGEKNDGTNKLDPLLDEYAVISRKVAKELKVPLCDLRKAFIDHLKSENPKNQEKGVLTTDRVHLNSEGYLVVAEAMLKALGEK